MPDKPVVPPQIETVKTGPFSSTAGQNDAKAPPGSSAETDQKRDELTGR